MYVYMNHPLLLESVLSLKCLYYDSVCKYRLHTEV